MKRLIAELPTLTAPMEKEELIVYLVAASEAVSVVLMTERDAKPRVSIKGQILVDFIVERPEDDSLAAPMEVEEELPEPWTLFTNGSSYVDGFGAELIFTNPEGTEFTYAIRFKFNATNNEAEYEALKAGLRIVLVEVLKEKSINEAKVLTVVEEEGNTWMTPIYEYLTEETLHVEINSRFGLPGEMISDNRKQFRDNPFKDWCEKLNIRQRFASVKHPQANDLVEKVNKSLREGMKARLDK
ncbi:reverse transcriptase domain-containing protein [Tanacetum coccineum]